MNETTLIPLLTFTGETISVEETLPQGVVATPGGTPTTSFEDLLAGLLITQAAITAEIVATPTDTVLDPTLVLPEEAIPAEVPLDPTDINDQLVNFFNVTPSGVPLPSQRVSVATTPTPETTGPANPLPTPLAQETPLTQQEPITLEQIRIRARSAVPTTTNFANAPPLPPVVALPNPDGTILARPPEPDDVRSRIPDIGAVAPSVTGLATSFGANQQTLVEASEQVVNSRSTTGSTPAPFALPDVPTEAITIPVSAPAASPVVIVAPTAATNLVPPSTPAAVPIPSVPTQPMTSVPPSTVPPPAVVTPTNATTVPVSGPNTATRFPPTITDRPAPAPAANTFPTISTPTPVAASSVTPPTAAVQNPVTPTANATRAAETVIVSPPAQAAQSTGAAVPGTVVPGIESNGYLPTFPRVAAPVVTPYPQKTGSVPPSERTVKIASDVDANSPTPLTSGEPTRVADATRTTTVEGAQPRSVVQQTADALIREASLTQTPGESEFRLRLNPAELGEIRIHLRSTAEGVTAHLTVAEEGVRKMIESQLPDLRQRLADAGVTVNGFNVSTDSGSNRGQSESSTLEQPFEWQVAAQQQQPAHRPPKVRPATSSVGLDVTA